MKNRYLMVMLTAIVAATMLATPALAQTDSPEGYSHPAHASGHHGGHHHKHRHGRHAKHRHGRRHHKHVHHE